MEIQLDKILEVVENDANGRGRLNDGEGHYCALGGLLLAAGGRPRPGSVMLSEAQSDRLKRVYGLEENVQTWVPPINDYFNTTEARRLALKEYFTRVAAGEFAASVRFEIVERQYMDRDVYHPRQEK